MDLLDFSNSVRESQSVGNPLDIILIIRLLKMLLGGLLVSRVNNTSPIINSCLYE